MRDQARTAADLSAERPPLLSAELSEAEREGLRTDLHALNEQIDDAVASEGSTDSMQVLRLAVALEVSAEPCDAACERRLFHLYEGLALAQTWGFSFSVIEPTEENAVYDRMIARSPALSRWAIGRVLSVATDRETVALALSRLAQRELADGELERAREALAWSLSVQPDASVRARLAGLCYRLGDLGCGDAELRALAGTEHVAEVERRRDAARVVARPATSIEAQLARAEALVTLGSDDDASALYGQLALEHPDDARPHVGLARMTFFSPRNLSDPLAWTRTGAHLDRAASLSHREATYYQLAILVWGSRVAVIGGGIDELGTAADAARRLEAIVTGMSEIDPATATAIDLYGRSALGHIPASGVSRPTVAEAIAARQRHPESEHVRRTALLVVLFAGSRPTEAAFASTLEDEETMRRARVVSAITWNDPALLGDRLAAGEAGAVALALRAHHGETPWAEVAESYRALEDAADEGSLERIRNGMAVALWQSGDHETARATFAGLTGPAATLNVLATTEPSARDSAWRERLDALRAVDDPGIACAAARALRDGAPAASEPLVECAPSDGARPERTGASSTGSGVDFAFRLRSPGGFSSELTIRIEPWLLVVP